MTQKKRKKGKAKETRFSYPNYPRHNFNPTCSPMTILPQLNVIGGLIKIGMEGGGRGWLGSRHQREKGILEGETTNANASGELQNISREHSATIAVRFTKLPLLWNLLMPLLPMFFRSSLPPVPTLERASFAPSLPPSSTEIFSLSSPIVCFPLQVKPAIFPFFPFSRFTLLTPRKRNTRLAAESADFARSEISPTFRASEEIRSTYKRMYDVYIV